MTEKAKAWIEKYGDMICRSHMVTSDQKIRESIRDAFNFGYQHGYLEAVLSDKDDIVRWKERRTHENLPR